MKFSILLVPAICLGSLINCSIASAQFKEDRTVKESIAVLNDIMAIPANGIPRSMLNNAQAVAIIPGVIKASFVVGARRGDGVVIIRDEKGAWQAPVFITLTGGNIGWQVGVQSTDVVLVFKTRKSVEGLLSGRFTLGADAAVAAGPLGRQAAAATDTRLGAQIYSYSRSRGLFAGVAFDGSVIRLDSISNASYYRPQYVGGPVMVPAEAQQLAMQIVQYAGNETPSAEQVAAAPIPVAGEPQILAQKHSLQKVDHLRDQLAQLAPELYELLDLNWQQYLALPSQVFQGTDHPTPDQLNTSLAHFDAVMRDPNYASLANNPEFQSTYGLLKHYAQELSSSKSTLSLPSPPMIPVGNRQ